MDIFNYSDYEVTVEPIFDGMEKKAIRKMREEEERRVILPQGCQTIPTYPNKIVRYQISFVYGRVEITIDKGNIEKSEKVVYIPQGKAGSDTRVFSVYEGGRDTIKLLDIKLYDF